VVATEENLLESLTEDHGFEQHSLDGIQSIEDGKVDGLKASIQKYGLLTPPLFDSNGNLLDGKRRIRAAKENGHEFIWVRRLKVNGAEARVAAIQTRISKREQTVLRDAEDLYEWKGYYEQQNPETTKGGNQKAKKAKKEQNAKLAFCKMAAAETDRSVRSIELLVRIGSIPAEDRAESHKDVEFANRQDKLLALVDCEKKHGVAPLKVFHQWQAHPNWTAPECINEVKKQDHLKKPHSVPDVASEFQILTGDFREVMKGIADESIDAVITDPPYLKEYVHLLPPFAKETARVLKPGGIALVMYGQLYLPDAIKALDEHLEYHWMIADDFSSTGHEMPSRMIANHWKPILIYKKGEYKRKFNADIFRGGTKDKTYHVWQQALETFEWQVKRFTNPGDLILDPFLGAGTTMVAALKHGRQCIGIDCDPEAINATKLRLQHLNLAPTAAQETTKE
jgi:16S rRNA G966 N2-methylase RsmD